MKVRMMSHQIEIINKETESIKTNQIDILELKSIVTEMKNSLEGLNIRFEKQKQNKNTQEILNKINS